MLSAPVVSPIALKSPSIAIPLIATFALSLAPRAFADASSWLYAGGGASLSRDAEVAHEARGVIHLELGVGGSPESALIPGGLVKTLTYFGHGTDLVFSARLATRGFQQGGLGFAVDAGEYERLWGGTSRGFAGAIVLGAPFGIQLALLGQGGSNHVRELTATVGIDLLRLTVYRTAGQAWWPNVAPGTPSAASTPSAP